VRTADGSEIRLLSVGAAYGVLVALFQQHDEFIVA
jgi:hypothetical protein